MEAKATCGQSSKTKSREIVQKAAYGGKECEGFAMESELVQLKPCPSKFMILACKIVQMKYNPVLKCIYCNENNLNKILVDCEWGPWIESKCNATCGEASKTKTRKIKQKAAYGGQPCSGDSVVTKKCNLKPCPGI